MKPKTAGFLKIADMKITWLLTILLACCILVTSKYSISYQNFDQFFQTTGEVHHLELDRYRNDGSLLVSTNINFLTIDGTTAAIIIPRPVHGFTQVNATHVVITESSQHCIKMLNRNNGAEELIAGTCGTAGYSEGGLGVGQFYYPYGVKLDNRNSGILLVTDELNHALRSVNLNTQEVSTVIESDSMNPLGLSWFDQQLLFTNTQGYISLVSWSADGTASSKVLAGSIMENDVLGNFNTVKFRYPFDIERIDRKRQIIADTGNRKLKLMDLDKKMVGPVCFRGENPCRESSDLLETPLSILNVGGDIYIGMMSGKIFKLSGNDLPTTCENMMDFMSAGQTSLSVELLQSSLSADEGVYKMVYGNKAAESCTYHLVVKKPMVVRRLAFKVEYQISCIIMKEYAEWAVRLLLSKAKNLLQEVCSYDCKMSSTSEPSLDCTNDLLTISWLTNELYPSTILELPAVLRDELKRRLNQSEAGRNLKAMFPADNKTGAKEGTVSIVFHSSCTDNSQTYIPETDTCA